ncbi:membrane associated rhomboid family serine protease [Aurantimicrobium minutum]|uniref:rhomboid family intramembrane serine protease n=1 Tax=Aurantimicrobium minutum TaxID=708131 RepID=UPI002475A331|nr:rhomboid family intramembrane serine protease [Aurantimicrobium minutum]MDH6277875.1 membrane associated rhomboid family serine protease [Aurantimicrobium minutum]
MSNETGFGATAEVAPSCYRHPDTPTFIRCQRCERSVCVQCQVPAPVGVICPECLGQAQARAPRVGREALGGRSNQNPVVTYTLIAITALFYVLQWIPGLDATSYLAYSPLYSYGEYGAIGAPYEPWRMITSVFTHSTGFVFHILLNMYTLWIFGQMLERMLGKARFITLYLASGLAGSLGVMFWAPHDTFVVGASGAIFGLMGAYLVIQRKLGGETTQLLVLVGINLVIGFLPGMSVSWQAHLGGLLGGALLGFIFVQTRKYTQKKLQLGLVSLTVLAFVALALSHAPMFVQG